MNQSSQNNLCHQIRFGSIRIKVNLVSLLQRRRQCDDLVTSLYLSVNRPTSCSCVNLVSLLQRQVDENQPLQWASRLVSLLQWHDQNRSLRWASQSLHSEPASMTRSESTSSMSKSASEPASMTLSMRWSTYSHRSTYQRTGLPRVPTSNSESATMVVLPPS